MPNASRQEQEQLERIMADSELVELDYQPPLAWPALTAFLALRGAACSVRNAPPHFVHTIELHGRRGWIVARPDARRHCLQVAVAPELTDALLRLRPVLRHLFDLDADPAAIAAHLRRDEKLAPLVEATPGLRVPGTTDAFELALRAVLGQQISVKAATTLFTRFTQHFGTLLTTPFDGLDRTAPTAARIADARRQDIIDRGLPQRRADTLQHVARAIADGRLTLAAGAPLDETREALLAMPGIGPWTADYITMRALGDADAFPERDLGLVRALGIDNARQLQDRAAPWRPWRAYAAMHLWHQQSAGG